VRANIRPLVERPATRSSDKAALIFSGLLVLAWPVFAFGSLFIFDAPLRGPIDGFMRWLIVVLLLSYPLSFFFSVHRTAAGRLPLHSLKRAAVLLLAWVHFGAGLGVMALLSPLS
jgi:hypothetical protein